MKICLLTCVYPTHESDRNLYSDLMDQFASMGHDVSVFRPDEARFMGRPTIQHRAGVSITSIPTGKIQKTNPVQKLMNTLRFEHRLALVALRQLGQNPLDLLLFATPPIQVATAVKRIKNQTGCKTYLLLKDIFPANAADLGMMPKNGWIWNHFRRKESQLYQAADTIGCMSPANKRYLLKHNDWIDSSRIEICPNSIRPTPIDQLPAKDVGILQNLGIPKAELNLIYGGNLGKPQGIDFLLEVLKATREDSGIHITIIGNGTEFHTLQAYKDASNHPFALMDRLPKQKFQSVLASMDVGLIFLDRRFTIPNFPSRLLDYLDFGLPVLAATDVNTDLGTFLHEENCGLWCESGDLQSFLDHIHSLKDSALRNEMGFKARAALETQFTVQRGADIILKHMA